MKKKVWLYVFLCLVLVTAAVIAISGKNMETEEAMKNKGTVRTEIVRMKTSLGDGGRMIPLQQVLEGLGSEIVWEEDTGNAYFIFDGIEYICQFRALVESAPHKKSIFICVSENKDSRDASDYIQLNPMSSEGFYTIEDNKLYLSPETYQLLFEALGCTVDFDWERGIVIISGK